MLSEVNNFIYEMESIYLKESDPNIVLNFIEKFYNNLIKNNNNMSNTLLEKTANTIIICADTMMLTKSVIKDKWVYKTGENYILNQNRGNETFDKLVKDIIDGYIPNDNVIRIVQMFFTLGIDSEYKAIFLQTMKERDIEDMNVKNNVVMSSFNKLKKPAYRYMYICLVITCASLLFSELYYFISLNHIMKITETLANKIRSIYVI